MRTGTRTARGERTRQRIVDAASQLVLERGIHRTTIEDIKLAADVSASQLYHHFADKHGVVEAVVDALTEVVLANELLTGLDTIEDLRAWRDAVIAAADRVDFRVGCPLGSLGAEAGQSDRELRERIGRGLSRLTDLVGDGLRRMRDSGQLRTDADIEVLALQLVTAYEGGLLVAQVRRDPRPLRAALDGAISLVELAAR